MPIDEFVCRQCKDIVSARCSVQEKQAGLHLERPSLLRRPRGYLRRAGER